MCAACCAVRTLHVLPFSGCRSDGMHGQYGRSNPLVVLCHCTTVVRYVLSWLVAVLTAESLPRLPSQY